jgi:hypothetical protein
MRNARSLVARPVTVDGVGYEYSGAYNAEEHGDSFQHDNTPERAGGQIRLHAAYTRLIPFDAGFRRWQAASMRHAPAPSRSARISRPLRCSTDAFACRSKISCNTGGKPG